MKILFICIENVNRSQIAESIFNKLSKKNTALSAGLAPKMIGLLKNAHDEKRGTYPPIVPMKELGYDLSKNKIKKLNKKMADDADKIIFMFKRGKHEKEIPNYAIRKRDIEFWEMPGFKTGLSFVEYSRMEKIRTKQVERRVRNLVARIG